MNDIVQTFDTQGWKRLKSWSEWWCRPNHLAMFTKSHTLLNESEWDTAPRTTNAVESINRQSIHDKGCVLFALLENIYTEDRGHAAKIVAMENNVTLSYASSEESRRKKKNDKRKRKRSSLTNGSKDNDVPPDKRRNIEKDTRATPKKRGRSLIGTKVSVEYQEMNGGVMKYMGWFDGTIAAFNRRDGYFIEFQDSEKDGKVIKGWTEWLGDIESNDVKLLS
ncbi:uncharacterized protein LOC116294047 [Actinia tenebrosa]|uniref:Uncharacterized protein LOC116294047 n=1 Tax=Actinia tenebrosa TaxID=6105 RepID=A0A6P8HM44_ACTTE|nr:uncharacterized protein LOC116294047 [Actinia tenebrosa]